MSVSDPLVLDGISDQTVAEAALRSITLSTSRFRGEAFYRELVRALAAALGVHYVIAGRLANGPEGEAIQTLAVWSGDGYMANIRYALQHTPCRHVADQSMCFHAAGVQAEYPMDELLVAMGAESYIGMPMVGTDGRTLGILVALDKRHMPERTRLQALSLLSIFAARCAAELQHEEREAELERLVAARSEQLAATRAALIRQEAAANLGSLAAALNHQLNTPLGTAVTLVSLVDEAGRELVATLQGEKVSRQRLMSLAQSLSDSARLAQDNLRRAADLVARTQGLDQGAHARLTEPVELRGRIQALLASNRSALARAGASVQMEAPEPVPMWQPSQWLDTILENLLDNSLAHALLEPGRTLSIALRRDATGTVTLVWSDDGPGVPEAELHRLFQPYAPGRLSGGHPGLGLHIVQTLLSCMGGQVSVLDSAQGLHLQLELPQGEAPSPPP